MNQGLGAAFGAGPPVKTQEGNSLPASVPWYLNPGVWALAALALIVLLGEA